MTSLLYPCRVWRKNTGPRESSLTASETASKSGENASRARPATDMSNARFASFFNRWLIFYDDVRQAATLDHIGEKISQRLKNDAKRAFDISVAGLALLA